MLFLKEFSIHVTSSTHFISSQLNIGREIHDKNTNNDANRVCWPPPRRSSSQPEIEPWPRVRRSPGTQAVVLHGKTYFAAFNLCYNPKPP